MNTYFQNPLVRSYLEDLATALAELPQQQAQVLGEQIRAHLAEAITPGATDDEIRAVLDELGPPSDLLAAAPARRRRYRPSRKAVIWAAVVAVVIAAIVVPIVLTSGPTVRPMLSGPGEFVFFDPNPTLGKDTSNLAGDQDVITIRPGHLQGYGISVVNNTKYPIRVVGPAPNEPALGSFKQPKVLISTTFSNTIGYDYGKYTYATNEVIPPGAQRLINVEWISQRCLYPKGSSVGRATTDVLVTSNGHTYIDRIPLGMVVGLLGEGKQCTPAG